MESKLHDLNWLHDQYMVQKKAMLQIAKELNTTTKTVSKYIKRYGFKERI